MGYQCAYVLFLGEGAVDLVWNLVHAKSGAVDLSPKVEGCFIVQARVQAALTLLSSQIRSQGTSRSLYPILPSISALSILSEFQRLRKT